MTQVLNKPNISAAGTSASSPSISGLKFQTKSTSWTSPSKSTILKYDGSASNHSDSEVVDVETEGPEYNIENDSSPERDEPWKNKPIVSTPTRKPAAVTSTRFRFENSDQSPIKITVGALRTTADEGFLEDFYNNSRLHLISTMKKEIQSYVAGWRKNLDTHKYPLLEQYKLQVQIGLHEFNESSEPIQPGE